MSPEPTKPGTTNGAYAPLRQALAVRPLDAPVLVGAREVWQAGDLIAAVDELSGELAGNRTGCRSLAVLADNGPAWIIADLAALAAGIVHVPLPAFFSAGQLAHVLDAGGVDAVLTDQPERILALQRGFAVDGRRHGLIRFRRQPADPVSLPCGTAKLSFTSGSTGQPKGACLTAAGLLDTARAVADRLADLPLPRHLATLPLALLLENVAGVHAALLAGAEIHLPGLQALGWQGMAGFDPAALHREVERRQAATLILVPELLKAWSLYLAASGSRAADSLRFVAVGGARVEAAAIGRARALGIPAYQGYGLTECGSVVSLNCPGDDGDDCGRPLDHARVHVADGEIVVATRAFLGYIGDHAQDGRRAEIAAATVLHDQPTGDLGRMDAAGHIHLSGRSRNLLVTSYGRNISPEWVESALLAQPTILQAIICGDARPWLSALIVAIPGAPDAAIAEAVAAANAGLPDYARIARWLPVAPFLPENGLATGNGRPRREAILAAHAEAIAALYVPESDLERKPEMPFHERLVIATAPDRARLQAAPIIADCLRGCIRRESYLAFLAQAYHHVRHTTPLLMLLGGRLPDRLAWLRKAVAEYIEEEIGHEEWILGDIAAAGGDADAVRASCPDLPAELMVAYAYDLVNRGNPAGFFGMVYVLEGTSVALALTAADRIQQALGLPDRAFSYLRSHGTLDQQHTRYLARLVDAMAPDDQAEVLRCAKIFFRLYGDVFRGLPACDGVVREAAA